MKNVDAKTGLCGVRMNFLSLSGLHPPMTDREAEYRVESLNHSLRAKVGEIILESVGKPVSVSVTLSVRGWRPDYPKGLLTVAFFGR